MRACAHKRDKSGTGVIILEENLVQIGFMIAEVSLFIIIIIMNNFIIIIIIIIITSNFTRSKSQPYRRIRGAV